jgi:repressor LexA
MIKLTDKQQRILEFIVDYVDEHGYPPSIREIGDQFQISSLRGVTVHLDALERKDKIKRAHTSRSITVIGRTGATAPQRRATFLPLVGTIAAGTPILAEQNVEALIPIPPEIVRNVEGAFVLRVKGDSMIDAHVMPRDLVVIRPQKTAESGEMVAVMIGDEATVKTIEFDNGHVRLLPANPAYDPIVIDREDSCVIGKVVGLVRNYQ